MATKGGHSGSPIVIITDENGRFIYHVVGIHTHKGYNNTNEGIVMSPYLKEKILFYAIDLCKIHKVDY